MTIISNKRSVWLLGLLLLAILTVGCLGGSKVTEVTPTVTKYNLTMDIQGEGTVIPGVGTHKMTKDSVVDLSATPTQDWEFYSWVGEDAASIADVWDQNTTIVMDGDKNIVALFANEYFEMELEEHHFMGSGGTVQDLTNNAPYPPGFGVKLKAEPDTEEDAFLNWSVEPSGASMAAMSFVPLDPRDYFEDYEAQETTFTVPDHGVKVTAYFTKRTKPVVPGEFDFTANNLGQHLNGQVGITEHYWDLSTLEVGTKLDFNFHARNLPDRFTVYYGTWDDVVALPKPRGEVFASGWVSADPLKWADPIMYPEGVMDHYWHSNVVSSNWNPRWNSGGKYPELVKKVEGKDILMIRIEGRDDRTQWDYKLVEN